MDANLLKNKTTEKLTNEIVSASDIGQFAKDNETEFISFDLAEYLKTLLKQYNSDKSAVFAKAQMAGNNYGYEIFSGSKKNISRDKLIQLCFGFPLTIKEAEMVLRLGGVRPLYPRDERDAYIMFALNNKYSLEATNELLFNNSLKTIE